MRNGLSPMNMVMGQSLRFGKGLALMKVEEWGERKRRLPRGERQKKDCSCLDMDAKRQEDLGMSRLQESEIKDI